MEKIYTTKISEEKFSTLSQSNEAIDFLTSRKGKNAFYFIISALKYEDKGERNPYLEKEDFFKLVFGEKDSYKAYSRYVNDILEPLTDIGVFEGRGQTSKGNYEDFRFNFSSYNPLVKAFFDFYGFKAQHIDYHNLKVALLNIRKVIANDAVNLPKFKEEKLGNKYNHLGFLSRLFITPMYLGGHNLYPRNLEQYIDEMGFKLYLDLDEKERDWLRASSLIFDIRVENKEYREYLKNHMDVKGNYIMEKSSPGSDYALSEELAKGMVENRVNNIEFASILKELSEKVKEKEGPARIRILHKIRFSEPISQEFPVNPSPNPAWPE